MSALTSHLAELETMGLIRLVQVDPELEYLFRHPLMHQAAYASMLKADRKELHRLVGEALERLYPDQLDSRALAPQLGRHFSEGGSEQLALKYYHLAGEAALASFANLEAEAHFRQALGMASSDRMRADLFLGLGLALFRQSHFEEAIKTWREGIELYQGLGDSDGVARLYARAARAAWYGDVSESLALCREGLDAVAGAADSPDMARLVHEAARALFFNGMPDEARPLCQQALEMAERLGVVDVQADALATMGMLYDHAPEEGLEPLTQAVLLAESAGLLYQAARAHTNLAHTLYRHLGDFRAAREHDRRAAELSRQRGSTTGQILGLGNVTHLSLLLGDFAEAEATLSILRGLLAVVEDPGTTIVHIRIGEAGLLRYRGRLVEATGLLRECQAEARQQGDLEDLCSANVDLASALVELCVLGEEPAETRDATLVEAERMLGEAMEVSERAGWPSVQARCLLGMVLALWQRGQEARRLLAETREQAGPQTISLDEAFLSGAEAMIAASSGEWIQAAESFERAAQSFSALGMRWWWARTLQAWAEVLVGRGQPSDLERARALYREAQAIYQEMDSAYYADLVSARREALREQSYARAQLQQQMAQELALAGRIQAGLLPAETPYIPGWEFAATLKPAHETSGDFYDFIPLPDGRLGILIADVADKGMGAALYMALSRTLIRTYAGEHPSQPEQALRTTNERILADSQETMFVTVFFGILDPASGELIYCNAGHNPPFLFPAQAAGQVRELSTAGMALGILENVTWKQGKEQIAPGDILVLYTDGVTEAQSRQGLMFGKERLLQAVQQRAEWQEAAGVPTERSAQDVQEALLSELGRFVGGGPQGDDITIVVVTKR